MAPPLPYAIISLFYEFFPKFQKRIITPFSSWASKWFLGEEKRKNTFFVLQDRKTLFFAKKAVLDFEKFIVEKYGRCHEKMFINIGWDDNQRRDLYYRGLKKYGYDFNFFYGRKVLSKRIK